MASVEFIQKRIAGKEKEIANLEKKIDRIEKAKATNWEKNPYYYNESDLTSAHKDLNAAKLALDKYKAQLEETQNKDASRTVKPILDFLDEWEKRCIEYYEEEYAKYREAYQEYRTRDHSLLEAWNAARGDLEKRKALDKEEKDLRNKFKQDWAHITQFNHGQLDWNATMRRDIADEKKRKYDSLVERVCAIVGEITDVNDLKVGMNGELNGIIIGTKGKCKVETIGAGGYNTDQIVNVKHGQIYHFRVLVKPVK